jgi:thiamine biosynthesis lipoprotein
VTSQVPSMVGGRRAVAAIAVAAAVAAAAAGRLLVKPASPEAGQVRRVAGHDGRYESWLAAMGTDVRLLVCSGSAEVAQGAVDAGVDRIRLVERSMSTYDPGSDVSRLNADGYPGPVTLPGHVIDVLGRSVQMSLATGGAFDVTYAPLRPLWREAASSGRMPGDDEVSSALSKVGSDRLRLLDGAAQFTVAGMAVDLGGIAKGYAIDLAVGAMLSAGAEAGLVDIGGDIRLFGRPEPSERWRVEVRRPPGFDRTVRLLLGPCAVATSGDYARGFRVGDQWFSHIVDPRTGRPVAGAASVTVVADDATSADALATALSVLGEREGMQLVDSLEGVECMMILRAGEGKMAVRFSGGFPEYVEG